MNLKKGFTKIIERKTTITTKKKVHRLYNAISIWTKIRLNGGYQDQEGFKDLGSVVNL